MRRLLQAVFNEPIPIALCHEIRDLGFDGVRIDAQRVQSAEEMQALIAPVLAAGLWPLVVVLDGRACAWLPTGTAIELRNEPDLEGPSPAAYRSLLLGVRDVAEAYGLELWGGSISNLNDRGFHYLRAIADALPERVTVHWYPPKPWLRTAGHDGRTRAEEIQALTSIIGDRTFGVSEFGFHTAEICSGRLCFRQCRRLTDAQATAAIRDELAYWAQQGAAFATLYQLHDGPTTTSEDRFGIRTVTGDWKPQADAIKLDR